MDIFKLLSRATKQTCKSSAIDGQSSKLPSAGTTPHPQLYHDPVPESRGEKRKRTEERQEGKESISADEELNFFASKAEKKRSTKSSPAERDYKSSGQKTLGDEQHTAQRALKLLDEDECRQVLRSHRLKIILLPSPGVRKASTEKPKNSSKRKSEDASNSKTKEGSKQFYPQPLLAFEDLKTTYSISRRLGENLAQQGYKIPTEVQMGSLPLLLRPDIALGASTGGTDILQSGGKFDLLAVAPTGSGKTLAFLIPIVNNMIQRRRESKFQESHRLEAIIVAPTKELASQIVNEGRKVAMGTGMKVLGMRKSMRVVEVGEASGHHASDSSSDDGEKDEGEDGINFARRSAQPKAKGDILVTTPLVLLHALTTSSSGGKISLPTVHHLVLDEADVLLDPLFREQTLGIWDACVNPDLRVTLWSATMDSNIEALASETIQSRRERLKLENPARLIRLIVGLKDSAIPNISHRLIYTATEQGKLLALRQLLRPTSSSTAQPLRPPFLVFTQTIPRAIALHSELLYDIPIEAGGSSRLAVLHSSLSDTARSTIMSRFRAGDVWILITTDILSRGVDFRGINGVVNYDVPNSAATYIHRVGRTGRAGRDGGVAVTFYTKEDIPYFKNIANVIAASEKQAGKMTSDDGTGGGGGLQKWLLDALPKPSKKEKKMLKMHGVEARRTVVGKDGKKTGKGGGRTQISTKSGFERRLENKRRGAIEESKRRLYKAKDSDEGGGAEDSDWNGFDE